MNNLYCLYLINVKDNFPECIPCTFFAWIESYPIYPCHELKLMNQGISNAGREGGGNPRLFHWARSIEKNIEKRYILTQPNEKRHILRSDTEKHWNKHCMKSIPIRSFSGPYFPAFCLNRDRYSISFRIQSECGIISTAKTPKTDTSYEVKEEPLVQNGLKWSFNKFFLTQNLSSLLTFLWRYNKK